MESFRKDQKNEVWDYGEDIIDQNGNAIDGSFHYEFEPIKFMDDVEKVAACSLDSRALALKKDGSVWAWGSNGQGQIGNGAQGADVAKPVKVLENAQDIAVGYNYAGSEAIKTDGSLWATGRNQLSILGLESAKLEQDKIEELTTPVQLTGIEKTGSNDNSTQTTPQTAAPTTSKVLVNGNAVSFDAYQINGNNYFKLRDIAKVISGTDKQFEVTWDGAKNAINLISGQSYTPVGGELAAGSGANQQAVLNTSTVYLDGKQINLTAYTIQGNNYFKLRDLGQTFDFGVGWDGANNTVTIDTSTGYTPE